MSLFADMATDAEGSVAGGPASFSSWSSCRVNSSSVYSLRSSSTCAPPQSSLLLSQAMGALASSVTSFCDIRASASCSRSASRSLGRATSSSLA